MRLTWDLPLDRLSASSLGMAIQCPEQFRQKYLLKTEERNFSGRFIGSVDHEMSRVLAQAKIDANVGQEATIEDLYKVAWESTLDKNGEPDWRDDDPVKMFKTGVKMSQLYWDEVISKPEFKPVAIETRIEFNLPEIPSTIVGYVDVMEANLIRERKTSAAKRVKPKPAWRFQGMVYQYATGLPVQWDVVTRQVTPKLYLAGDDNPDLYMPVRDPKGVKQMIVDTARMINDLYGRYGRDNVWPTTGVFGDWLCDYCPIGPRYGGSCQIWN